MVVSSMKTCHSNQQMRFSAAVIPSLQVTRYNTTTTPYVLSPSTGLEEGNQAMGRYLDVDLGAGESSLEVAAIWIYYRHSDLDINKDGQLDNLIDLNESTLILYYYNIATESWMKLSEDMD